MKWKFHTLAFFTIFFVSLLFILSSKNDFIIRFDIQIVENNNSKYLGELFYTADTNYNSKEKKTFNYKQNIKTFQPVKISIINIHPFTHLRFDPLLSNGLVKIKNFTITYMDKTYQIDFSKIKKDNSHNISIEQQNKNYLILRLTGSDPYFELSHNIIFHQLNRATIINALLYTLIFYIAIVFISIFYRLNYLHKFVCISILYIYTAYTLLFLSPTLAMSLLLYFALFSSIISLYKNTKVFIAYTKIIGTFLLLYILLSLMSLIVTTKLADSSYLYNKIPYIILAAIIPVSFYKIKDFNLIFFKIVLSTLLIVMAIIIFLLDHQIISINHHSIFGLTMERIKWTQKNYMFWYILLMFGTLSFYNIRKKIDFFLMLILVIISYIVVFGGYSLSARLSFSVGIFLYTFLSIFYIKKKYLLTIIWIFTIYIIFSPIIFALIDFTFLPKLVERDAIYKMSFALIKEHWIFGYGYGSTLALNIKDFVTISSLPKHYLDSYPGGHPHNLSLLFWLEFGVIGAAFLAYYIHKLLKYIIEETYNYSNQAGLLAMIVAFDIITSFSWSIWYPQVLLTFAFFGIMLVLSMNIKSLKLNH